MGAWGCREDATSDAFRGGHGEVGVLKFDNGDSCGAPLESWWDPADEEGRETETAGGRRAMRVRPKTRRDADGACGCAELSHSQYNLTTHSQHNSYVRYGRSIWSGISGYDRDLCRYT
jgi:hypothetical protein